MRYLVIASCEDVRSGREFEPGEEFLPEPDVDQADRLVKANWLRPMPDSAPTLPGTDGVDARIAALEADNRDLLAANDQLRGKVADLATRAGSEAAAANAKLGDLTKERDQLVGKLKTVEEERDRLAAQTAELERQLAEATKPAVEDAEEKQDSSPPKAKR